MTDRTLRRPMRVYADTSVFGGVYDKEFEEASRAFFDLVCASKFRLVVSAVVLDELVTAPDAVRLFFNGMLEYIEVLEPSDEADALQQAYMDAEILSSIHSRDAFHVASATVSGCAMIVSWNFRHIVNYRRVPLYNAVNVGAGYTPITICSPLEVVGDEEE
ncbi:MAG: hypothetical protein QG656_1290 [Candidatus Hydrogenedentes bacterium]|nr:hypothetical protein [Candidatus Hydrogenedentota bacterium]